ncbi:MAG: undecaprenyl-phosphate glucose phosphotransferase [Planctomycetes bacterium]|nr:undecaprenyl-phosphate glucose phosphotransferase [Planctomycetota bacterium]
MLRKYPRVFLALFIAWELALTAAAFVAASLLSPVRRVHPPLIPVVIALAYIAHRVHDLHRSRREGGLLREGVAILRATATLVAAVLVISLAAAEIASLPTTGIAAAAALFGILDAALLAANRVALRLVLRAVRRRGYNLRHAIVLGSGPTAERLVARIRGQSWMGIQVRGALRAPGDPPRADVAGAPVLGEANEIEGLLRAGGIDQVFVAVPLERFPAIRSLLARLPREPVSVRLVLDIEGLPRLRHRLLDIDGLPVLSICESPVAGWRAAAKRAMDLVLGSAALVLFSPLMGGIALCLRDEGRGKIFYRQLRVGLDGRPFRIWKFRTMRGPESDAWTGPDDPRVTPLGRLLRRTSLDELPQLFNVIEGTMSLVGPRPERPCFIDRFRRALPQYPFRHKVKAGMTGWAQVNGWRGLTPLERRLEYDLAYIERWSLALDLKILWLTLFRGFVDKNAY